MEGRLICELTRIDVGRNEGSDNVVGLQPGGGDVDPVVFDHFDIGESGEGEGGGAAEGAGQCDEAVGGEVGGGLDEGGKG